jgi:3-oxoacyl-[acyl-carrier protein] reductase
VLVNNAGTGTGPNDGSAKMYELMAQRNAELARGEKPQTHVEQVVYMEDEGWRAVMGVNLDGAFYCTREALRIMAAHNIKGSIINIASTAVQSGEGPVHYVTSKTALVGMTRAIAREVASRGIRINAVRYPRNGSRVSKKRFRSAVSRTPRKSPPPSNSSPAMNRHT